MENKKERVNFIVLKKFNKSREMNAKESSQMRTLSQSPQQQIPLNPQVKSMIKCHVQNNFVPPYDPFEIEILRVQTKKVSRIVQKLFTLNEQQLNQAVKSYISLPYSPIDIKQLFSQPNCRLIKSQGQKIYMGQTLNKKKHGKGVAIYGDGRIYEGVFQNNKKSGFGVELYSNGNFYIGNFKQNQKHGIGTLYWFNLSQTLYQKDKHFIVEHYVGEWWAGIPDGKGEHRKSNGDLYKGDFRNGLKHGKGIEQYRNGDQYDGEFVNGLCEGTGTYKWLDGSQYDGDFKQGYRNGFGIWQSVNQKYQGQYMLDKKHGYGIYDFGNGFIYKGNYIQDQRNGQGQLYHGEQLIFKANWMNGQRVFPINQIKESAQFPTRYSTLWDLSKIDQIQTQILKPNLLKQSILFKQDNKNQPIQYCIAFKKEQQPPKTKIGHRNCIPCQQRRQIERKNQKSKIKERKRTKSKQDMKAKKSDYKLKSCSLNNQ